MRFKPFDDDDVPDDFILPPVEQADIARGALIFKLKCAQCHTIRKDGRVSAGRGKIGPSLYGVYGRTAGNDRRAVLGPSKTMRESGLLWTDINLMRYLRNPRWFTLEGTSEGTSMNFRGIDDWQERIDLIWYLKAAGHEGWLQEGADSSKAGQQDM